VRTGRVGGTTVTHEPHATLATGVKLFTGSKSRFLYIAGATTMLELWNSSV
jgi:hypothetical protein